MLDLPMGLYAEIVMHHEWARCAGWDGSPNQDFPPVQLDKRPSNWHVEVDAVGILAGLDPRLEAISIVGPRGCLTIIRQKLDIGVLHEEVGK